jgi:hypothetical protein
LTHKCKAVYVDGERYISDAIVSQIEWLKHRSEEIVYGEGLTDKEAVSKLYQLIGMLSHENN